MNTGNKCRTPQPTTIIISTNTKAKTSLKISQWVNCAMICLNLHILANLLMKRIEIWSPSRRWVHRNLNTRLMGLKRVLIKLRDGSWGKREGNKLNIRGWFNLISEVKRPCSILTSARHQHSILNNARHLFSMWTSNARHHRSTSSHARHPFSIWTSNVKLLHNVKLQLIIKSNARLYSIRTTTNVST